MTATIARSVAHFRMHAPCAANGAANRKRLTILLRYLTTVVLCFAGMGRGGPVHAQAPVNTRPREDENRWTLSLVSSAPVTAADVIEMATVGSQAQGYVPGDEHIIAPDGEHVAVVVKRGNLARNTVDFALLVFDAANLLRRPTPDTVVMLSSSSNRPGIERVRWLADNATLAFLGERPGELPQVYTLDTRTRALTQRTHASTVITTFDVAPAGEPVVYAAEESPDTAPYAAMRARGFVVPPKAFVGDLMAGEWLAGPSWEARRPRALHVVRRGADRLMPLPDSAMGYTECFLSWLSIAPTGDLALIPCTPRTPPAAWAGYLETQFRTEADRGYSAPEYVVLNLATGQVRPLTATPFGWASHALWAPDGRSVVMTNALLPLTGPDSAARATHNMVAEVDVQAGSVSLLVSRDSLVPQGWNARTGIIELVPGWWEPARSSHTTRLFYRKTPRGWAAVPGVASANRAPALTVDQGLNAPPRLVVVDPRTQALHLVYDPNPGLLTIHRFGREEIVHWRTKAGDDRAGGLYWPPDYVPGRRYPLVIQTHGFDSTAFWPYGAFSTGQAAQPLANAGIMVLQVSDPPAEVWVTPREAPSFQESVEGAIDALDRRGLIDRTKVGLSGFSRTCFYALYFLTHSSYPIAAARLTDGIDGSYVQYLGFGLLTGVRNEFSRFNGGEPFGTPLAMWRQRSPGFNLDRVTTPLQLTALASASLLTEWEPYAGLLLQAKAAELVYLPDASHILVKPWERLTSQQGAVDWYRFWLQGAENSDSTKAEQYVRWRELRSLRQSQGPSDSARGSHAAPP